MKRRLFALLHSLSAIKLVSWLTRRRVPIVCYHSVTQVPVKVDPHKQHIPLPLFLQHLDYLQKHYRVISLSQYLEARRENRRLPHHSAVLTFDDGFADFYSVVAPELNRRKIPATVFVITDRASGGFVPNGESFLTWDQIRELAAKGVEIGSHSCSHPRLTDLSVDEITRELADSREALATCVGHSRIPLSYPFGQMSGAVAGQAEALGYTCAIANDAGPNSDTRNLYELSRTVRASDDDLATFAGRISGLTWLSNRARSFLRSENDVVWEPSFTAPYASAGELTRLNL